MINKKTVVSPERKCAAKGCGNPKFEGHDFCIACIALDSHRPLVSRPCDNLQAISDRTERPS